MGLAMVHHPHVMGHGLLGRHATHLSDRFTRHTSGPIEQATLSNEQIASQSEHDQHNKRTLV